MKIDDQNKKPPLYIFLHIPKTGGTTFGRHLIGGLKKGEAIGIYSWPGTLVSIKSLEELDKLINSWPAAAKDRLRVIHGHNIYLGIEKLFPDREIRYLTFFREPLSRAASHYNFYRQKFEAGARAKYYTDIVEGQKGVLSFEEAFLKNKILHNYTFKFLADFIFNTDSAEDPQADYSNEQANQKILAKIKAVLKKFYFIGLTENSEDDFLYFYYWLGVKKFFANQRRSKKFFDLSKISPEFKNLWQSANWLDGELYKWAIKSNEDFKKSHPEFQRVVLLMKIKRFFYLPQRYLTSLRVLLYKISAILKKKSNVYAKLINKFKFILV